MRGIADYDMSMSTRKLVMKTNKLKVHGKLRERSKEIFAPSHTDSSFDAGEWNPSSNPNMKKTTSDRRFIEKSLVDGDSFVFEFMTPQQRAMVIDHMESISFCKDDFIIRQGEEGDYFYVIKEGKVNVYVSEAQQEQLLEEKKVNKNVFGTIEEEKKENLSESSLRSTIKWSDMIDSNSSLNFSLQIPAEQQTTKDVESFDKPPDAVLGRGDTFGEIALLYNCPRMATCIAKTSCDVWCLNVLVFRHIMESNVSSLTHSNRCCSQTSLASSDKTNPDQYDQRDSILSTDSALTENLACLIFSDQERRGSQVSVSSHAGLLEDVPLLRDNLDDNSLEQLTHAMIPVRFRPGEHILKKGFENDTFYIIKSGQVRIHDIGLGDSQNCDIIASTGESFGEEALFGIHESDANITAVTETITLALPNEDLNSILGSLQDIIHISALKKQLRAMPMFGRKTFKTSEYEALAKLARDVSFKPNDVIATAGKPFENALYIVITGKIQISNEDDGCVNIFTCGDHFGGRAMSENKPVSCRTIEALEASKCKVLTCESIESVIGSISRLGSSLRPIAAKLDQTMTLDDFSKECVLGVGSFGLVWLVQHKKNNAIYALKTLEKETIVKKKLHKHVMREKNVMASVDHPFIINLKSTFQDNTLLYLVIDFIPGGELFSVIHKEDSDGVPNDAARFYAACVYESLNHLHHRNICYRDLKPENILIDKDGYCKLIDLGFAKVVLDKTLTMCGTPDYLPPEIILRKGHNRAVDLWAFGVLVYEMIVGQTPFYCPGSSQKAMLKRIAVGRFAYPDKDLHGIDVSPDAQDIINKLIVKKPDERLGYIVGNDCDVRRHAWFDGIFDGDKLLRKKIEAPWMPTLKNELDASNFEDYKDEEEQDRTEVNDVLTAEEHALFDGF